MNYLTQSQRKTEGKSRISRSFTFPKIQLYTKAFFLSINDIINKTFSSLMPYSTIQYVLLVHDQVNANEHAFTIFRNNFDGTKI